MKRVRLLAVAVFASTFLSGVAVWSQVPAPAPAPAPAQAASEARLQDGSLWRGVSGRIVRVSPAPELEVLNLRVHQVGIKCAEGNALLLAGYELAFVPAPFLASLVTAANGANSTSVCADKGASTFSATLRWRGSVSPADAASFRLLLSWTLASVPAAAVEPATLPLFSPPLSVRLDRNTGDWVSMALGGEAIALALDWPATATTVIRLDTSTGDASCGSTVFPPAESGTGDWIPQSFIYRGTNDRFVTACKVLGNRRLTVTVAPGTDPRDHPRIRSLLLHIDAAFESAAAEKRAADDAERNKREAASSAARLAAVTNDNERAARVTELLERARAPMAAGRKSDALALLVQASVYELPERVGLQIQLAEAFSEAGDPERALHAVRYSLIVMRKPTAETTRVLALLDKYQLQIDAVDRVRARAERTEPLQLEQRRALIAEARKALGPAVDEPDLVRLAKMNDAGRQKALRSAAKELRKLLPAAEAEFRKQTELFLGHHASHHNAAMARMQACEDGGEPFDCDYIADLVRYPRPKADGWTAIYTIYRLDCLRAASASCYRLQDAFTAYGTTTGPQTRAGYALGYALRGCESDSSACWRVADYLDGKVNGWTQVDAARARQFREFACLSSTVRAIQSCPSRTSTP